MHSAAPAQRPGGLLLLRCRPRQGAGGRAAYAASFGLRLHDRSTDERFELFRDTVESDSERWREKTLDLSPWSLRWVELCVETVEVDGSPEAATEDFAFWSNLVVIAGDDPVPDDPSPEALTDEEAEARREHLRALGYIQ